MPNRRETTTPVGVGGAAPGPDTKDLWYYLSEAKHWIFKHQGGIPGLLLLDHLGGERNTRERYRGHPKLEASAESWARWDQTSFDPDDDTLPLAHFEPMVRAIFAREPRGYDRSMARSRAACDISIACRPGPELDRRSETRYHGRRFTETTGGE